MTQKRFVKLLMSKGRSKSDAQHEARYINKLNWPYSVAYNMLSLKEQLDSALLYALEIETINIDSAAKECERLRDNLYEFINTINQEERR